MYIRELVDDLWEIFFGGNMVNLNDVSREVTLMEKGKKGEQVNIGNVKEIIKDYNTVLWKHAKGNKEEIFKTVDRNRHK